MADKEGKRNRISAATILTVLLTFVSGGFAGAVFTWYVNRPQATVLTYAITTTSLGTSEVSSVVPNLKIQIGSENIDALYTHTIELTVAKGPFVDKAEFAITLPAEARIFGMRSDAPSALQSISCSAMPTGSKCALGPLSSKVSKPFRVAIATNRREWPSIDVVAKNVDLMSSTEYLKQSQTSIFSNIPDWLEAMVVIAGFAAAWLWGITLENRSKVKKGASVEGDQSDEVQIPHY
jgi:hypothetical protein